MLPGYLHLDCRRGLRADLLNAALLSLLSDHEVVVKAIDALAIDGVSLVVREVTIASIKGFTSQFVPSESDEAKKLAVNVFGHSEICVKAIQRWLDQKPLAPSVNGIAQKILAQLVTDIFTEHKLCGRDALYLVCHVVLFSAIIDALDPKFITATKIGFCEQSNRSASTTLSLSDSMWLNQLLINMPAIEMDEAIPVDVVGIACIKALAGHIGVRGESRIHKVGIGLAHGDSLLTPHVVEALWCEPTLPESMNELGFNNYLRLYSLHEVAGVLAATTDVAQIISALTQHGAMGITCHLAQREKSISCYVMRFLVRDADKRDTLLAFLIKAAATDVTVTAVERHELNKRLVSVPIGTGNKTSTVRFFEFIYLDKTVRVEPVKEDLDLYVQKTDYSVDVARSDLMLAWKKWRGRVVSEDA